MLNRCEFIGNLGADPEVRHLTSGDKVVNFRIAVSERWKDKQTGERKESTEWVTCVVFRGLADVCEQYLRKGSKVFVAGKMKTRKWQAQDGSDRYSTEVVLSDMEMLDTRDQGSTSKPAQSAPQAASAPQAPSNDFTDFDDDIPFD